MRRPEPLGETESRSWQTSLNDLLTILLTFFILLLSVSSVYLNRTEALAGAACDAFGPGGVERRTDGLAVALAAGGGVDAYRVEGGLALVLDGSLLFPTGSATLGREETLRAIGEKLRGAGVTIRVEGHTDSLPVANRLFASNWELSVQRAVNVVKFLIDECGIEPERLSAAGYADSRPVAPNDTPAGRLANRRVAMIISFM